VLTDIEMPEMDGPALTAALRKLEAAGGRRVPIIGITAQVSRALANGVCGEKWTAIRLARGNLGQPLRGVLCARPAGWLTSKRLMS